MKKNKLNIICSWLFLICFVAGQYTVNTHQHNILKSNKSISGITKHNQVPSTILQEKCPLCDAMHHTAMVFEQVSYHHPLIASNHIFKVGDYNFKSISLILAAGRGPPASFSAC
ncbi:MAG: hypothetical protein EOP47_01815 [Sphingobacteriaceae bacterium]|nr:MAG: hypothetical protein EOP47_01815 [Sphingobacteriaceae bacterium]